MVELAPVARVGAVTTSDEYIDFIDTAYAVPEEPERFEDLLALAQRFVADLPGQAPPEAGSDVRLGVDERFVSHAQRVARAIEREDALSALARAETFHAQLTVNRLDLSVRGNLAAERLMGRKFPCQMSDLPLDRRALAMLARNARMETAAGSERRDQIILATIEEPQVRPCLALVQRPPDGDPSLRVAISYIDWSPALIGRLAEAFGLTDSETEVLDGYLNNLTGPEVAELRGRSPETVKVQVKAILRKTGCPRMHEVIQLSASIAYLLRLHEPAGEAPLSLWAAPTRNMRVLKRPGQREAAFYVEGEGSRTVLFFHGLIQGPYYTRRFLEAAKAADLRIVSPSRPGYGFSTAAKSRAAFNATAAEDAVAILDNLGVKRVLLAATKVGASHACRTATALGDRATGLVMVGAGVPVFNEDNLAQMDAQTRVASVLARYAPSMLGLTARLGIAAYRRKGGVRAFLHNYLQGSARDMRLLDDPETARILDDGVYHVVQDGAEAWVRDSISSMAGWEPDYLAVKAPKLWIHGDEDRVVKAASVEAYVKDQADADFVLLEGAGMHLIHEQPEAVAGLLAEIAT